jgi:hypothetical protein
MVSIVEPSDVTMTLRYYVDVALPIGRQTIALWLVFPEDLEEAAEMLAER